MGNSPVTLLATERYEELLAAERMLKVLEAAGVDNWKGYETAIESLENNGDK